MRSLHAAFVTTCLIGRSSIALSFLSYVPVAATKHSSRNVGSSARLFLGKSTTSSILDGQTIVPVETCIKLHGEPDVVFIDGSWFLKKDRNGRDEFERGPRIPNARFFDIDQIAATGKLNPKGLPHMMPPKALFAAAMDAMEISNEDHLIVYATKGCTFVHRSWFQLRAMGHPVDRVHLMDGTLDDWEKQGGPLEEGKTKELLSRDDLDLTKETKYVASDAQNVVDLDQVKAIVEKSGDDNDCIIVDARPKERFLGQVAEPRPGLKSGHMPGAKNIPFINLLDPENVGRFKPRKELKKIFKDAGVDPLTKKKIVTTCGSGATACALVAGLEICGRKPGDTSIYDGSWSEWGAESDTPIVK